MHWASLCVVRGRADHFAGEAHRATRIVCIVLVVQHHVRQAALLHRRREPLELSLQMLAPATLALLAPPGTREDEDKHDDAAGRPTSDGHHGASLLLLELGDHLEQRVGRWRRYQTLRADDGVEVTEAAEAAPLATAAGVAPEARPRVARTVITTVVLEAPLALARAHRAHR